MKRMRTGVAIVLGMLLGLALFGQEPPPAPPPGQPAPAGQVMPPQQLDDLVAPIALYPDNLLSQILAASTYPLEVVEAGQWLAQNKNLRGQQLMEAAQHQNWDPSVQALVAFPDVLARLNQDVRWTTDLGNAFLAQQGDVMAAVQRMRARAQANGKLQSTPQENVTTLTENGGQTAIQIQPPNPETVYVPVYNPEYVWGPPAYGYYPPLFYPPVGIGFSFLPGIDLGFYFGGGWGLYGGLGWGWGPNWFGGGIFVNPYFFHRFGFRDFHPGFGGNTWAHDAGHRLGVAYPNRELANRFRGGEGFRGGAAGFRSGEAGRGGQVSRAPAQRAPVQRFGTQGFDRRNPGANRSAFSGAGNGAGARMQSDHGFSSMGHAGGAGRVGGGGGHVGGGGGGGHAGGGGGHGGGGRR